jgi:hypothetical protein
VTSRTTPVSGHARTTQGDDGQGTEALQGHRIAVLNEWVEGIGGAERVLSSAREALPTADVYALWDDRVDPDQPVRESWLSRTPLRGRKDLALPLMPVVWRTQTRQRYDVVLSFSHSLNHTAKLPVTATGVHLSYVHTPARYLWLTDLDARRRQHLSQRLAIAATKRLEQRTSRHVTAYAANSHEVRRRIEKFWHREATVIYPPARTTYFSTRLRAWPRALGGVQAVRLHDRGRRARRAAAGDRRRRPHGVATSPAGCVSVGRGHLSGAPR